MVSQNNPVQSVEYLNFLRKTYFTLLKLWRNTKHFHDLVYSIYIILQGTLCRNGILNITIHFTSFETLEEYFMIIVT